MSGVPRLGDAACPKRTGLVFARDISFERWQHVGRQLSLINNSSIWWLGDWLVYGERNFSARYRQAIERTTLDYQTLRNYAWVARRIEMSRRRDTLSLQHHAEVAGLGTEQQDELLNAAERERWSRNQLRRQVKKLRSASGGASEATTVEDGGQEPHSSPGEHLHVPGVEERNDVVVLYPDAAQRFHWEKAARVAQRSVQAWAAEALDQMAEHFQHVEAGPVPS